MKNKTLIHMDLPILNFSFIFSHNLQVIIYLSSLNSLIEHLDIFQKM